MTTTQWILNGALLAWVLLRNLGTRRVGAGTYLVPVLVVNVAAVLFLRDVPTDGNDAVLEALGIAAGLLLGVLATGLTRITADGQRTLIRAGAGFAALWIAVIGGRIAFAEWATHAGARAVGEFSLHHAITGADAWTAAFVLMALAMVVGRTVSTGVLVAVRSHRTGRAAARS
jgi:hypothetical protein